MDNIVMFSDGGARGNPGPAGIGVVIKKRVGQGSEIVREIREYINETTNNQAEYQGLIAGLQWIKENISQDKSIQCNLDSELIVKQLNGEYKIKNEGLKPLFWQVRGLVTDLGGRVIFQHIPREQNKRADELVNQALDENAR